MSHIIEARASFLVQEHGAALNSVTKYIIEHIKSKEDDEASKQTLNELKLKSLTSAARSDVYLDEEVFSLNTDNIDSVKDKTATMISKLEKVLAASKDLPTELTIGVNRKKFIDKSFKDVLSAMIDERKKLLSVIENMKDGTIIVDDIESEATTTVDSCVSALRRIGMMITKEEFINEINFSVWEKDSNIKYLIKAIDDMAEGLDSLN